MNFTVLKMNWRWALCGCALMVSISSSAQEKSPEILTWGNVDQVESYVRLKSADENYQMVNWHSTVIAGQREAQKQDKPLLLWLYFGDPRANC